MYSSFLASKSLCVQTSPQYSIKNVPLRGYKISAVTFAVRRGGEREERRGEREREREGGRENEKLTEQWAPMLSIPILSSLSWTPLLWRTQPTCACTFAPTNMKTIHLNVKFKALRFTLWNFLLAQYSPQGHLEPLKEVYMCVCVCVFASACVINRAFYSSDFRILHLPLNHEQAVKTRLSTSFLWVICLCVWITWLSHDMHMGGRESGETLAMLTCIKLALTDHAFGPFSILWCLQTTKRWR